jgi:hypothetical protein
MRFEYILLCIMSLLPLLYQFTFWWNFLRDFKKHDLYGQMFHFWIFVEVPLIILALYSLHNPPFEIFLYNMTFYFLVMYNIFVIGKIFRRKHSFHFSFWVLSIILCIAMWWLLLTLYSSLVYLYILIGLSLNIIYFIPTIFISKIWYNWNKSQY